MPISVSAVDKIIMGLPQSRMNKAMAAPRVFLRLKQEATGAGNGSGSVKVRASGSWISKSKHQHQGQVAEVGEGCCAQCSLPTCMTGVALLLQAAS